MENKNRVRHVIKRIKNVIKIIPKIFIRLKNKQIKNLAFLRITLIFSNEKFKLFKINKIGKLYTLASFASVFSQSKCLYIKKQRMDFVSTPIIYPYPPNLDGIKKYYHPLPDLNLTLIEKVIVIGGTNLLIKKEQAISDELLLMEDIHDLKCPDIYHFIEKKSLLITSKNRFTWQIDVGLHLLKEHSLNYYHWLSECLPRFLLFLQYQVKLPRDYIDFKILIDENLPYQCLQALKLVSSFAPVKILMVPRGKKISCKKLIYPAPFWFSLDNTKFPLKSTDFVVDRYGLMLVKNAVEQAVFNKSSKNKPFRNIYLKRASHYRNLLNQNEIESLLTQKGFEIILAEKLSFIEQVKLFSETKIAIGPSGAVFTNMLFMQPNTLAVIFSPLALKKGFSVFEAHADVAKTHLINLLPYYRQEKVKSQHDDFFIDLTQLENLLADQL